MTAASSSPRPDGAARMRHATAPADSALLRECGLGSFLLYLTLGANPAYEFVVGEPAPNRRVCQTVDCIDFVVSKYITDDLQAQRIAETWAVGAASDLRLLIHSNDRPPDIDQPAWAFQRRRGSRADIRLMPDLYYLISRGYRELRQSLRGSRKPWRERQDKFFWRGATTGAYHLTAHTIRQLPRYRLCQLGSKLGPFMDLAITTVCQTHSHEQSAQIEDLLKQAGVWSEFVPKIAMADYKFLFDIDGNANSWGLLEKLLMGACVIKVDSPWEQWFYPELHAWTHYVPVAADLGDLAEKVEWCLQNPARCEEIAAAGEKLASGLQFDLEMRKLVDDLFSRPPARLIPKMVVPQVTQISQNTSGELIQAVRKSFAEAMAERSEIDPEILSIPGMSGRKYRMFMNNLVRSLPDARYLEVGSYTGSTLCSAISRNRVRAVAIDNWSQFNGPKHLFEANLQRHRHENAAVNFIESDFYDMNFGSFGNFNVYFYDGDHATQPQYDGIARALPALDAEFILIVDDWNWHPPRQGTLAALADLRLELLFSLEIRTTLDDQHVAGEYSGQYGEWHNGCFIAVVRKPRGPG